MANLATLGIAVTSNAPAAATGLQQLSGAAVQAQNAINGTTNAARQLGQQTANMSYQFQDIGVQLVGGQSPFMILAQQLPQLTMHGGKLTGIVSGLKQTFAGFISPLGLVTTGLTLAAYAAIQYFQSSEDSAKEQAEELQKQSDLISRVAEEWGAATPAIASYADELERVIDLQELQQATAATIGREFESSMEALKNFELNVDELGEWNEASQELVANIGQLSRAANELEEIQKSGGDTTEAFANMQKLVADIINSQAVPATGSLRDRVNELADAYSDATSRAQEAAEAAALLEARGGVGISEFGGGRGSDPRGSFKDEGGYWEDRMFPDPEKAYKAPRAARKTSAEREAERAIENYAEMIQSSQQYILQQQLEQQTLGMTEEAAAALRYEQEMLNQAANDNIDLTAQQRSEISSYAAAMAYAEEATRRATESMEFVKDTTRGFFDDLRSGLEQGKSLWESFANAALNALDKIVDKLLDDVLNALFQVSGSGGGGIGGLIGSLFGGGGASFGTVGGFADMLGMASGGYTGDGGKYQPAGIVHKGEYVFSAAATRRIGAGNLDRAHRAAKGSYAEGGMVGGQRMFAPANDRVQVEVSISDDGELQAFVKRTSLETSQAVTTEGIKQYDKSSAQRLPRDAKQVRARMGVV